jgi:antitoxin (DNA-binding transcriptional repressor) of toxin-antitoxin stability system
MTMIMINIHEAKAKLSEYLEAIQHGEQVLICKRNRPVAELRVVERSRVEPRDLTPVYPDWKISPAFFEPLTDEVLDAFERSRLPESRSPIIAEKTRSYATKRRSGRK